MPSSERTRLGILYQPIGRNGAIRCRTDSDTIVRVLTPCDVWIGYSEGTSRQFTMTSFGEQAGSLSCTIDGITDRESAQNALSDRAVYIEQRSLVYADAYSHPALLGYTVNDEDGNQLGILSRMFRTPAHTVWVIVQDSNEYMIPAVDAFIMRLVPEASQAIIRPIPGMFENDEDAENG